MKAVGIVVEYNPFHNGHLYHLQQSKETAGADIAIAVMSGNFLQRGEPALVSKWSRTKMALQGGVDIVVELPYAFATQKAETFANGAVSILEALHCDSLCFGSESGSTESFHEVIDFLESNQEEYDRFVKEYLKKGYSYPKATSLAFHQLSGSEQLVDLSKPNNILGVQYVKAIKDQKAAMVPKTIQRISADYHDEEFSSQSIASATSIRKSIFTNKETNELKPFVPNTTWIHLNQYLYDYNQFHHWETYFPYLKYTILTMSKEELRGIYEMEEGLENRIFSNILHSPSFQAFMTSIKTKRYTWTRLQRLAVHILTRTTKNQMNDVIQASYIRLLGLSKGGQKYLNQMKKTVPIPIVSKLSSFEDPLITLDIKAAYAYSMAYNEPVTSAEIKNEFSIPPIRFDESENIFL
ncbi:nucleotidyltransferase [Metabacillus arenae]|uniref:tRNA(Met) cytidine acetate ligase n=1 Tax=Metabacillus arenae TaxID=2771434 RepID=A0A926RWT8_9BACI|nr:nucleotidyltransferase [Metabacillus arenae]MBD1379910.1 nucleotidyltransferase [Metabacillus arenae]